MSEKMATELKIPKKKIKLSTYLNILLGVALLIVLIFGWFYLKGSNPVENARDAVSLSSVPTPEYLYTIYGSEKTKIQTAWNTVSDGTRVYVIDAGNSRVAVFDYNGKFLFDIGKPKNKSGSRQPGDLINPFGIALVNNEIYVSDAVSRLIYIFNTEGKFLRYFASKKIYIPASIYYKNGKFYINDAFSHSVRVFDSTGKELLVFGKRGAQEGNLNYANGIYVDDSNNIYVADSNNNRIQVFDEKGKFKAVWNGKDSEGTSGYSIPRGLAVDSKGNFYTAEVLSSDIVVSKPDGTVLTRFSYAEPPKDGVDDKLLAPTSVFIDQNQRLYVTEFRNARVLVYKIRY